MHGCAAPEKWSDFRKIQRFLDAAHHALPRLLEPTGRGGGAEERSGEVGEAVRRPWPSYDVPGSPLDRLHTFAHTAHGPTGFAHVS